MASKKPKNISEYISLQPVAQKKMLTQMRAVIRKAVPGLGEKLAWGMPTFTMEGNIAHIAGFKNHVSFFPGPVAMEEFADQMSKFETSKGTLKISLDQKVPVALLAKIMKFQKKRHLEKRKAKKKKGTPKMFR